MASNKPSSAPQQKAAPEPLSREDFDRLSSDEKKQYIDSQIADLDKKIDKAQEKEIEDIRMRRAAVELLSGPERDAKLAEIEESLDRLRSTLPPPAKAPEEKPAEKPEAKDEGKEERLQGLQNQTIVLITDRGLQTLSRTARGPFSVLKPQQILITRKEAINPLLSATDIEAFLAELEKRDIDFLVVDKAAVAVRPWNLLSSLVTYMLTHGVSSQVVILLLTLPVIATILAFLKQVIGVTTFGLYTPSIIALSFLALGWEVGLIFLLFILLTGYATRSFMRRWRLQYIPKVAIILTVVSITLMILLGLASYFGITFGRDTVFVLLIMSTLSESFLNVKAEEGWYSAMLGIGETILAALLCIFIVQWSLLQSLVLAYPELILLTIVINLFLGKWTGLRLVEYFRFREVFKHLQEE